MIFLYLTLSSLKNQVCLNPVFYAYHLEEGLAYVFCSVDVEIQVIWYILSFIRHRDPRGHIIRIKNLRIKDRYRARLYCSLMVVCCWSHPKYFGFCLELSSDSGFAFSMRWTTSSYFIILAFAAFRKLSSLLVYLHETKSNHATISSSSIAQSLLAFYCLAEMQRFFLPSSSLIFLSFTLSLWVPSECNVELSFISLPCSILPSATDFLDIRLALGVCIFRVVSNV